MAYYFYNNIITWQTPFVNEESCNILSKAGDFCNQCFAAFYKINIFTCSLMKYCTGLSDYWFLLNRLILQWQTINIEKKICSRHKQGSNLNTMTAWYAVPYPANCWKYQYDLWSLSNLGYNNNINDSRPSAGEIWFQSTLLKSLQEWPVARWVIES